MVAVLIAVVVLLSRLPFTASLLFQWDSVLYAQALEHGFHVDTEIGSERPHPPGYILYVGLARLVRVVTPDSNAALVTIAVVASALAAAGLYVVARRYAPPALAALCALGLAASPLVWQQSEVALPYTLLALLSIVFAGLFLARRGRSVVAFAIAFGLAAGLRQDLPLLLGPLWLWSLAPVPWSERLRAIVAFGVTCLVWFVPAALLSGGLEAYLAAIGGQAAHVGTTFSIAARGTTALLANLAFTTYALAWGIGAFALVVIVVGGARLVALRGHAGRDALFFALWIVAPLAVYVGLHIGDPGYVLSLLPGVYVLCAALLARLGRIAAPLGAALVLANAIAFLSGSSPFTAQAIAAHSTELGLRVAAARALADPTRSHVLAQFDYLFVRYYLPAQRALFYGDNPDVLSRDATAVVLDPRNEPVFLFGATQELPAGLGREPVHGAPGLDRVVASTGTITAFDVERGAKR